MAHAVHHIRGRLRIKNPAIKGNAVEAHRFAVRAAWVDGVREASCNPRTGSLLIHYDPLLTTQQAILQALDVRERAAESEPLDASRVLRDVAESVAHSLAERLVLRSARAFVSRFI